MRMACRLTLAAFGAACAALCWNSASAAPRPDPAVAPIAAELDREDIVPVYRRRYGRPHNVRRGERPRFYRPETHRRGPVIVSRPAYTPRGLLGPRRPPAPAVVTAPAPRVAAPAVVAAPPPVAPPPSPTNVLPPVTIGAPPAPAKASIVPTGSYALNCKTCSVASSTVSCDCERLSGAWSKASIDFSGCAGHSLTNLDGVLVCGP